MAIRNFQSHTHLQMAFPPRCWKHRNPFLGSRPQVGRSGCLEEAVEDLWAGEHWTSPISFVLLPFSFSLLYSLLLNPDSYALTGGSWLELCCWRKRRERGWRLAAPCCHAQRSQRQRQQYLVPKNYTPVKFYGWCRLCAVKYPCPGNRICFSAML